LHKAYIYTGLESHFNKEQNTSNLELPEGSMLIINNYYWLHGRDQFIAHKNLHRELLRKRGAFSENTSDNDK
jgi:protein CsiD